MDSDQRRTFRVDSMNWLTMVMNYTEEFMTSAGKRYCTYNTSGLYGLLKMSA
jgi:hypothetical protein